MRLAACLVLGTLLPGAAMAAAELPRDLVRMQGLDKVTARTSTFDVGVGDTVRFGTLEVRPDACFVAPPTASPESAAFLTIVDHPPNDEPEPVFAGWMFASSPAISALDHAVYDVWVLECLNVADLPRPRDDAADDDDATQQRLAPRRRPEAS